MEMTSEQRAAHLANLVNRAEAYYKKIGFQIIDRTPAGYGPVESSQPVPADRQQTTEEQSIRRSIAEGETLLRGKMPAEKRAAIIASVNKSKLKLETL